MIIAKNISKKYKTPVLKSGFMGNLKNLFAREYREIQAVDDISFTIQQGEVVGLIGANGAGKSTTIKLLTGILTPDSGEINVNGYIPQKHHKEYLKQIGVVFGQRSQLWWDIGVEDSFRILKDIYEIDKKTYHERLDWLVELLDIKSLLGQPVRTLSLGQRMRCDLVASLLHNPKILFLDEPTIGLDIYAKIKIREFLIELNKEFKTTILLTSHDLFEIEKICSQIMIIDKGKIFFKGKKQELKEKITTTRTLKFEFGEVITADIENVCIKMSINYTITNPTTMEIKIIDSNVINVLLKKILEVADVKDLVIEEQSIEDILQLIKYEGVV